MITALPNSGYDASAGDTLVAADGGSDRSGSRSLPGLGRVRAVVYLLFGVQLVIFLIWSQVQAHRFGLAFDYSIFGQAWYSIAHGHLDPWSTIHGEPFWHDHSAFLFWITAPLWYLWPHPVTLLWLQDVVAVATEVVAFNWMAAIVGRAADRGRPAVPAWAVLGAGATLLLADPWILWSLANDFHVEVFGIFFCLLAARDLSESRRRAWLWVALALATSNLAATYVIGLGMSALLAGRQWRKSGYALLGAGGAWAALTSAIHGDAGSALVGYRYLLSSHQVHDPTIRMSSVVTGVVRHPVRAATMFWSHAPSVWADLSSTGLIGIATPWALGVPLIALLENGLQNGTLFISPNTGFQNVPEYFFLPVGTVIICAAAASSASRRIRRLSLPCLALPVILVLGWAVVWFPKTAEQWLRVTPSAVAVLSQVQASIAPSDEVIVSQGVAGAFSTRESIHTIQGPGTFPVQSPTVWVIVTPRLGIELQSVSDADALIEQLSRTPGSKLEFASRGVWAFRWSPGPGVDQLAIPGYPAHVRAWASPGPVGEPITNGPSSDWYLAATGAQGYVLQGDYFYRSSPGRYGAHVRLATTHTVDLELWDSTTSTLLGRRTVPSTDGAVVTESVQGTLTAIRGEQLFSGYALWWSPPPPPPVGDQLEVRIWTPGGADAAVYSVDLARLK